MTNETAIVQNHSALIAEFTGGSSGDVEMMIGIGLVKDSDAVFFQYMGDDAQPQALVLPSSGKPLTRLANVRLTGIGVAENVGEFGATKLNLYLQSNQGRTIMLTSGITTLWSQCVVNSLMGLKPVTQLFTLDSWKGKDGRRPCFAAVRANGQKVSDNTMYQLLADARATRDQSKVEKIMREAIDSLATALGGPVEEATIDVATNEEVPF